MSGRTSFRLLILVSGLAASALAIAAGELAFSDGVAVPPGSILTWCGRWFGALYGIRGSETMPAVILAGLIAGMALLGGTAAWLTWWQTRQLVRRLHSGRIPLPATLVEAVADVGLAGRVWLVKSPDALSLCFGYLRPTVCLSTGFLDVLTSGELKAVLVHEREHLLARDPLKTAVATCLAAAFLPFPLITTLRRSYVVSRELDADQAALSAAGRPLLASAMYKMLTHPRPLSLSFVQAVSGWSTCVARLNQLLEPDVSPRPRIGLGVTIVTLATIALLVAGGSTVAAAARSGKVPAGGAAALLCDLMGNECVMNSAMDMAMGCFSPAVASVDWHCAP